jgi:ABC-type Na+ efflux pump permease subunit
MSLVIALTMLYIVGMMISNTCEKQTLMGTDELTLVQQLVTPPVTDWSNLRTSLGSLISIPIYYVVLMVRIGTFDFSFFYGTWAILRILFCAIGVGLMVGWITILRGVHSQ